MPTTRSLEHFGAVGDGVTNNDNAIAAAVASGDNIHIPPGNFRYSKNFTIASGTTWQGDGHASNLVADTKDDGAVVLSGTGQRLRDFRRSYVGPRNPSDRTSRDQSAAVSVSHASDFAVEGLFIDGASGVGIIMRASVNGLVAGNSVKNTLSDGIHMTGGYGGFPLQNIRVVDNLVQDVGDDCIAVVAYELDQAACERITVQGNHIVGGGARGIVVAGGSRVVISGNVVTSVVHSGIYVNAEAGRFATFGGENVIIADNDLNDCGSPDYGAIFVGARGGPNPEANPNLFHYRNVRIVNNMLKNCRDKGIRLVGTATDALRNISVGPGNCIEATGDIGIQSLYTKDLVVRGNTLKGIGSYGCQLNFGGGLLQVSDNVFENVNTRKIVDSNNYAYVDVILVDGASSYDHVAFRCNFHRDPNESPNPLENLIHCLLPNVIDEANIGGYVSLGSNPVRYGY